MRVFLAGATGAIGRPLVPKLLAAGHHVTGMTRSDAGAAKLRAAGVDAVVCDVFDAARLNEAVAAAKPDVLVHQLTALPQEYEMRDAETFVGPTNRLRTEGTTRLLEAARGAGVKRVVAQSIAFIYAPEGSWVKDETARVQPPKANPAVGAVLAMEAAVTGQDDLTGVALRYGQFYGPGTYYARDGSIGEQVRKRRFPIVGAGTGVFSLLHVEDAADAAIAALDRGEGIYNIVDDEPAPLRDWLPAYAEALGAKPPFRVPAFIARLAAGQAAAAYALQLRGASNAKAKRELGWTPAHASWREGFREALA